MKEILILSGKGGTGKTNFASSYAIMESSKAVAADCDVDAADMHLILKPRQTTEEIFYSGYYADVIVEKCLMCNKCKSVCNFEAIKIQNNEISINENDCEGCGFCYNVCPNQAIVLKNRPTGYIYTSDTVYGIEFIHAKLFPGGENSGKLVSAVKKLARQKVLENNKDFIIIDGSPGIGCPVAASLSGTDYVVLITEPSLSGFSDLKRLVSMIEKLSIKCGCIINKADINIGISNQIMSYLADNNIDYIDSFDFDKSFIDANRLGIPITIHGSNQLTNKIKSSWEKIIYNLSNK